MLRKDAPPVPSPASPASAPLPGAAAALRGPLISWYSANRRELPWRRTGDPYPIWIAEVMLQQTTVAAVIPYWRRFVDELPDMSALAAAPLPVVLRLWSGLGYYNRARNLHRAAREMVLRGRTSLPSTVDELRALPGVGEYTAAAVASIAFGVRAAVVDGNVRRVLTRLAGFAGDPRRAPAAGAVRRMAEELIDPRAPGDWNQALMELGATVCTPRRPRCGECPWAAPCVARAGGEPERLPSPATRPALTDVLRGAVRVRDARGRWLLVQAPAGAHNAGLWSPPAVELARGAALERARLRGALAPPRWRGAWSRRLAAKLRAELRLTVRVGAPLARVRHAITTHRIAILLMDAELVGAAPRGKHWRWTSEDRLAREALTGEARKLTRISRTK